MRSYIENHQENLMGEAKRAAAAASGAGSAPPPRSFPLTLSSVSIRMDFSILVRRAATFCLGEEDSASMISTSRHRGCYMEDGRC